MTGGSMKTWRATYPVLAVLALGGVAACTDAGAPERADLQVAEDLALSAGDAAAVDVPELVAAELFGGFAGAPALDGPSHDLTGTRSRTCHAPQGNVHSHRGR